MSVTLGSLAVGPLSVHLSCDDPRLEASVRARYGTFLDPSGGGNLSVRLRLVPGGAPCPDAGRPDEIEVALLPWGVDVDAYENGLRRRVQAAAVGQGLLLLHAAGLVGPSGSALVIMGPGGAGKTTLARNHRQGGGELLGDDLILVDARSSPSEAWAVPFHGDVPPDWRRGGVSVCGVLLADKTMAPGVHPAPAGAAAVACVMGNVPFLDRMPREGAQRALAVAHALVRHHGLLVLGFGLHDSAWKLAILGKW